MTLSQKGMYRTQYRRLVFERYGMKCECCGESNYGMLTIAHPEDYPISGNEHRRRRMEPANEPEYWLIRQGFPPDWQVLCWNCNWSKSRNNGVCEHEGVVKGGSIFDKLAYMDELGMPWGEVNDDDAIQA